jgi:hypothetical protein
MSGACAASTPDWLSTFASIWHVDFEFQEDKNHHPVPVCLYAFEQHTGSEVSLWRDELLQLHRAPFGVGSNDLMVCFTEAELKCFIALGWRLPRNVLDLYVEVGAAINGRSDLEVGATIDGRSDPQAFRPGLIKACSLYGLPLGPVSAAYKDRMRDAILGLDLTGPINPQLRREIKDYNRSDVVNGTVPLLNVMAPEIDLPRALYRGRYMAAVAGWCGLPVDVNKLAQLTVDWGWLQLHYIQRDDVFGLYEGTSFCEQRLFDLIAANNWDWPLTEKAGKPELKRKTLERQARRYPELKSLVRLRDNIAELRVSKLAATVGADGYSRISTMPFWAKTGRNQPSAKDKVFLPSLPAWLHGLLRPPPGYALIEFDWVCQEQVIAAALSGDANFLADCTAGDPHTAFGVRAGLLPPGATKNDPAHRVIRDRLCKPCSHGALYGQTPYGLAAKTGRSLIWARGIHARHQRLYSTFYRWRGDVVASAQLNGFIESVLGWPMVVDRKTKPRTLMNFIAQASAGDAMRLAAIEAAETGIQVCCSVHDAFWVLCPIEEGRPHYKTHDRAHARSRPRHHWRRHHRSRSPGRGASSAMPRRCTWRRRRADVGRGAAAD